MPLTEMSSSEFLALLDRKGIQVQVREDRLQVNARAGAMDQELRDQLLLRKAELLSMLSPKASNPGVIRRIPRSPDESIPQTPAQQGLWLIDHFDPGNVAYNIPDACFIPGRVDLGHLQHAVDQLLLRHDVLRTTFFQQDGDLFQRIVPNARTIVGFSDLSADATSANSGKLQELVREHARQPFRLDAPPLIRFHLFRLADNCDLLLMNVHHIVADGPALKVLRRDLDVLYDALSRGLDPNLPDNSVQFPDYALWAAQQLESPATQAQIQYWRQKLAGVPPFLELPHSHPLPAKRSSWGATRNFTVEESLRRAVVTVGQQEGGTPFLTFLSTFALLLFACTGAEDFCIGSPMTHRKSVQTEEMVGMFAHMLAFRCQPAPQLSFRELLRQLRGTALDAYENSDVPFQRLLRALKPERRQGRTPIFQVLFGFDTYALPEAEEGAQPFDASPGTARYDLSLNLLDIGKDGLIVSLQYCTDLFTEEDAAKLEEAFRTVLQRVAEDPNRSLAEIAGNIRASFSPTPLVQAQPAETKSGPIKGLLHRLLKGTNAA